MRAVIPLQFDPQESPQLTSPIMGIFINGDLEINESHIKFILEAVRDCEDLIRE